MSTSADVQAALDAYWSGRAAAYDAYQQEPGRWAENHAAWSAAFATALPDPPCDVLDVGSGSGYVAFLLADLGHRVTATDLAPGMLDIARRRAEERAAAGRPAPAVRTADAVDPGLPPASVDAVTSRYLLWTLREPDRALASWRRLLRPGGVVVAVDGTWFPDGLVPEVTAEAHGDADGAFARAYGGPVRRALPLAESTTMDAAADLFRAAGLRDVTVTPLTDILALDRRFGVAPGHEVQLQYLIRGTA